MVTDAERGDDYRPLPGFTKWWERTEWSHEISSHGSTGRMLRAAFTAGVLYAQNDATKEPPVS